MLTAPAVWETADLAALLTSWIESIGMMGQLAQAVIWPAQHTGFLGSLAEV
ncbi:MAG: hypothetical protein ACEQSD_05650 [Flavobacteriales bacterium]